MFPIEGRSEERMSYFALVIYVLANSLIREVNAKVSKGGVAMRVK